MRSAKLLLVAVLAVVLALSSTENAFASLELFYDDGTQAGGSYALYAGVRFTVSDSMRVVGIRLMAEVGTYAGYITGPDHTTVLKSFPVIDTVGLGQWNTVSITDGPVVSGDFYVVIQELFLGRDQTENALRSYVGGSLATLDRFSDGDWMLRALLGGVGGVVGGVLEPVNTFASLSPWVAVIGLVCVATAAVVAKKRRA